MIDLIMHIMMFYFP